jgi:hypothetical protein
MSAAGFIDQVSGRRFQTAVSSPIDCSLFYGTALKGGAVLISGAF